MILSHRYVLHHFVMWRIHLFKFVLYYYIDWWIDSVKVGIVGGDNGFQCSCVIFQWSSRWTAVCSFFLFRPSSLAWWGCLLSCALVLMLRQHLVVVGKDRRGCLFFHESTSANFSWVVVEYFRWLFRDTTLPTAARSTPQAINLKKLENNE